MLGVGVGVAEEPLLRDLADGKYRPAVARGAHFFNAHPYLAGLAVGAAARAEHDGASPEQIERLRTALAATPPSPCGPLPRARASPVARRARVARVSAGSRRAADAAVPLTLTTT